MFRGRIGSLSGWLLVAGMLASCGLHVCRPTSVSAQSRYGAMPVPAILDARNEATFDAKKYREYLNNKGKILRGSLPYETPENKNLVHGWYLSYVIPTMTQLDELEKLPEKRIELLKDLRSIRSNAVHKPIVDVIFGGVKAITAPSVTLRDKSQVNLHPAVRYNAMLLLGDLNNLEISGTAQPDPDPYMPAFNFLVTTALIDAKQPDYLKMAAMVGILRHAKLDWTRKSNRFPNATRKKLIELLMAVVNQKTPPATVNRSAEGHVWMRRRAIEIVGVLGALSMPDIGDPTNATLQSIVADRTEAPSLRCTAAATLRLTSPQSTIDSLQASEKLGALATQICRRELAWIDAELAKRPKVGTDEDGYGSGLAGPGGAGAESGFGGPGGAAGGLGSLGRPGMGPGSAPGGAGMGPGSAPGMGPGMGPGMAPGMSGMGPGMSGMGPGMMGGMGEFGDLALTDDPRLDLARRRLKYQLVCVDEGLSGIGKVKVPAAQIADRKKILDRFAEILQATDLVELKEDEPKSLDTLAKRVRSAMSKLEAITGGPPPETEAEAPAISAEPAIGPGPSATPGPAPGPSPAPAPGPMPGSDPAAPGSAPAAPDPAPAAPGPAPAPGGVPAKAPGT